MARRRTYKRDSLGRFAGGSVAGAAVGAVVGGAFGSKTARRRYIPGSLQRESHLGTSADGKFTEAKIGARYTAPGGREVIVKGIVGVSKPKVTKPPKVPSAAAAAKIVRQSATSGTAKATNARAARRSSGATSSAGRKVRR